MFSDTDCPCTGANLDKLIQPAILMILAQEQLHGYMLIEKMAKTPMFGGVKPDSSGVYRYLKILEERELIESAWNVENTGPARRIFKITDKGLRCLCEWKNALIIYRNNIDMLIEGIEISIASGGP